MKLQFSRIKFFSIMVCIFTVLLFLPSSAGALSFEVMNDTVNNATVNSNSITSSGAPIIQWILALLMLFALIGLIYGIVTVIKTKDDNRKRFIGYVVLATSAALLILAPLVWAFLSFYRNTN